jgi:hypothetical protein
VETDCFGNTTHSTDSCQTDPRCDSGGPGGGPGGSGNFGQFSGYFTTPSGIPYPAGIVIHITGNFATQVSFNNVNSSYYVNPDGKNSGAWKDVGSGETFSGQFINTLTGLSNYNITGLNTSSSSPNSGINFVLKQTAVNANNVAPSNPGAVADDPNDGPDVTLYGMNPPPTAIAGGGSSYTSGNYDYSMTVTVPYQTKFSVLAFAQTDALGKAIVPLVTTTMSAEGTAIAPPNLAPTGAISVPPLAPAGSSVPIRWNIQF